MPFEYYNVEDDIVAKLIANAASSSLDIDIVHLPEDEDEVSKAIAKPRLTVAFVSAVASPSQGNRDQSYHEELTIVVNVQWKALRGATGCHTLASWIKKNLVGYKPGSCDRMYFKNYQGSSPVRNPDDKLWYWDLEFGTKKLFVQSYEDEITGDEPTLNTVNQNESFN